MTWIKKPEFFHLMQGAVESDMLYTVGVEKMAIEWC